MKFNLNSECNTNTNSNSNCNYRCTYSNLLVVIITLDRPRERKGCATYCHMGNVLDSHCGNCPLVNSHAVSTVWAVFTEQELNPVYVEVSELMLWL